MPATGDDDVTPDNDVYQGFVRHGEPPGCGHWNCVPCNAIRDRDLCPDSLRVDGSKHSWHFDLDDPRIYCVYCGELRDALTGETIA
jgi:hypothetical protein